jgi:glycosyltransferase involved in cell wall biosynthesis
MPVFNGEKYLAEAMDSILNQTYGDFEFLVIDDGSTDRSREIVSSYRDPRIRLVSNERNSGLGAVLNKGMNLATGEYVARMDSDDVSLPTRLDRQVAFMDVHDDIGLCGSWIRFLSDTGACGGWVERYPTDHDKIKCRTLFSPGVAHPAVVLRRREFLDNGLNYDPAFRRVEDYDLWARAVHTVRFANLPEVLLRYRISSTQGSTLFQHEQRKLSDDISVRQLRDTLGITLSGKEEVVYRAMLAGPEQELSREGLADLHRLLMSMKSANDEKAFYAEPHFSSLLGRSWFNKCHDSARATRYTWGILRSSPLYRGARVPVKGEANLILKCLLKFWQ